MPSTIVGEEPAAPAAPLGRIDVHSHFHLASPSSAPGPFGRWTAESTLAFAADHGIDVSLLSLPFAADAPRVNDAGAALVAAHPDDFGLLATLPMGEPASAVNEVGRAFDELGADGLAITTNYDGVYLGDPVFEPVFAELDRRGATVFLHPHDPAGMGLVSCGRPGPVLEYPFDTARAVIDMVYARVFQRFEHLRMIVAHAGGPLASMAERVATVGTLPWVANPHRVTAGDVRSQLAGLYYDTALAGGPHVLHPVLQVTDPDHLVYGSDFPPATVGVIEANLRATAAFEALTEGQRRDVATNAAALFPRVAALLGRRLAAAPS